MEASSASQGAAGFQTSNSVSAIVSAAKRAAVLLGSILSVGLGGAGLYLGVLQVGGNFHTVVPGELYRSAQPTAALIAEYRENYGIKTIINLRGDNIGSSWYDAQASPHFGGWKVCILVHNAQIALQQRRLCRAI